MSTGEPRHCRVQQADSDVLLTVDEARARILSTLSPLDAVSAPILDAVGQVLAEDVVAGEDIPPFANSAMDGYALRMDDVASASRERAVWLKVRGESAAGHKGDVTVESGTAVRIMTGAPLPKGADAVVRFEEVEIADGRDDRRVAISRPIERWLNVRHKGEDVAKGSVALAAGIRLGPAKVGLLAALNRDVVMVTRRPRVAILATGDEIVDPGPPLGPGQIRNSNSYLIAAMARQYGGAPQVIGVARDRERDIIDMLERARGADLLVTSGGVSVGDFDVVKRVLRQEGRIDLWQVRMRPGRPLAFGRIGATPLLGLPGNPVAAAVAFSQFGRPAIRRMLGLPDSPPPPLRARLLRNIENRGDSRHFVRGIVSQSADEATVEPVAAQGSGSLSGLANANCFIVIPEEIDFVARDAIVAIEFFDVDE